MIWSTAQARSKKIKRSHAQRCSLKGWCPESSADRAAFNTAFRDAAADGLPEQVQNALRHAVSATRATTSTSRRQVEVREPLDIIQQRWRVRNARGTATHRTEQKMLAKMCRKWGAQGFLGNGPWSIDVIKRCRQASCLSS
eukprot:5060946-Karenia_brevis.AAC.1